MTGGAWDRVRPSPRLRQAAPVPAVPPETVAAAPTVSRSSGSPGAAEVPAHIQFGLSPGRAGLLFGGDAARSFLPALDRRLLVVVMPGDAQLTSVVLKRARGRLC